MEIEKAKEALEKQQQLAEKAAARAVPKPQVVETPKISLFGGAKKPVVEKKGKLSMIPSLFFTLCWYFAHVVVLSSYVWSTAPVAPAAPVAKKAETKTRKSSNHQVSL